MLDDRFYMRSGSYAPRWSATMALLVTNAVCFLLQSVLEFYRLFPVATYFYLSPDGLAHGYVWQLVTFQFLHGGFWHLAFNLLVLYFFGRAIESALGPGRFLKLYLASGTVGGLVQTLLAWVLPGLFGGAVVGASAGIFGLVAAFATLFPEQELTLLLFLIVPVSMRARTLLWLSIAVALFGILVPMDNVANAAHLAGIFTGWAYIYWIIQRDVFSRLPSVRPLARRPRELVRASSGKRSLWQGRKHPESDDLPPAEFISQQVDPILDKISAHGIQSLTERERKILEAARAKMAKR
ncbi:MAG: rhomboid family intramembrane serine protease [Verrucomicrobia bacterium]|nr:rhomboid family intramembrane serine protease [Verrucomicrobiota bacterium]